MVYDQADTAPSAGTVRGQATTDGICRGHVAASTETITVDNAACELPSGEFTLYTVADTDGAGADMTSIASESFFLDRGASGSLSLDIDFEAAVSQAGGEAALKTALAAEIAFVAGRPASDCTVISVRKGSVFADFNMKPDTSSDSPTFTATTINALSTAGNKFVANSEYLGYLSGSPSVTFDQDATALCGVWDAYDAAESKECWDSATDSVVATKTIYSDFSSTETHTQYDGDTDCLDAKKAWTRSSNLQYTYMGTEGSGATAKYKFKKVVNALTLTPFDDSTVSWLDTNCACGGSWTKEVGRTISPSSCSASPSCDSVRTEFFYFTYDSATSIITRYDSSVSETKAYSSTTVEVAYKKDALSTCVTPDNDSAGVREGHPMSMFSLGLPIVAMVWALIAMMM